MPNRIIKESICTSDSIATLSWFEQALFFRLIVLADDYGRFDARPAIIRGRGFPLSSVTEKQIADGLSTLVTAGIINLYSVGGKSYLQLEAWQKHQQIRSKRSKYPAPTDQPEKLDTYINVQQKSDETCKQLISDDIRCNQVQAYVPVIQSESESESESEYIGAPAPATASSASEIIGYLNEKAGTRYKPSSAATKRRIEARMKENFTVDDFKTVIDKKCAEWINDPKMREYLRPETLFGTKFESYLNTPGRESVGKHDGRSGQDSPGWGTVL